MSDSVEPEAPLPPEDSKMEIHHKPKPVHGWREFTKEYLIIVLGVLTALAAEQAAEWLHWRQQVADTRIVLGNELGVLEASGLERVRLESCFEKRLDAIAAIVDQASRGGMLPPVPEIGRPPGRSWPDNIWQNAVASGTAVHFPAADLNVLSNVYSLARVAHGLNDQEAVVWAGLYTMVGPGRRLDPASDAALRDGLSKARFYNRAIGLAAGQMARAIGSLNMPHDGPTQARIDAALRAQTTQATCRPMTGNVPPHYGQATISDAYWTFRDWQKYPPYAGLAGK